MNALKIISSLFFHINLTLTREDPLPVLESRDWVTAVVETPVTVSRFLQTSGTLEDQSVRQRPLMEPFPICYPKPRKTTGTGGSGDHPATDHPAIDHKEHLKHLPPGSIVLYADGSKYDTEECGAAW